MRDGATRQRDTFKVAKIEMSTQNCYSLMCFGSISKPLRGDFFYNQLSEPEKDSTREDPKYSTQVFWTPLLGAHLSWHGS